MAIKPRPTPKRERKKLRNPKAEVRDRLLEAAATLIRQEGFLPLRVEDIAEAAQLSVGTFYLYFDGKDDLFVQLVVEFTGRLQDRLRAAYATDGPFSDRMQRALDAYVDFVEENAAGFLYFRDSGTLDTTVGRLATWALDQHAADLRPVLEQAMDRGELRRDDADLMSQATIGVVQHLAGFWLENREHCSRDLLQRFINHMLMFGFGVRTAMPGRTGAGVSAATGQPGRAAEGE